MKYNWPNVVAAFRKIIIDDVIIVGNNKNHEQDLRSYFKTMVLQTDTFHPFSSDCMLSEALTSIPDRCDYRNVRSYWAWKNGRDQISDALAEMLFEVDDDVVDYFSDAWNFPPGYIKPKEIKFRNDDTDKFVSRILSAARK
jgi:hypothetical protein